MCVRVYVMKAHIPQNLGVYATSQHSDDTARQQHQPKVSDLNSHKHPLVIALAHAQERAAAAGLCGET